MKDPQRAAPHSVHLRFTTDQRTALDALGANTGWNLTQCAEFTVQAGLYALQTSAAAATKVACMRDLAAAAARSQYRTGVSRRRL